MHVEAIVAAFVEGDALWGVGEAACAAAEGAVGAAAGRAEGCEGTDGAGEDA